MASISSSTSAPSNLLAKTGMGGLASGMDIDALVEQMTANSRNKILKQQQGIQKLEWKQTAYRSVATALKEFQSKYLDVLSPTNFMSQSFFNTIKASASSTSVSVNANSGSYAGSFTIDSITQLATNQVITSSSAVTKALSESPSAVAGFTDYDTLVDSLKGSSIGINVDGRLKIVTFDQAFVDAAKVGGPATADSLGKALQGAVDKAFGTTGANTPVKVSMSAAGELSFDSPGSQMTLRTTIKNETDFDALKALGFRNNQSNKVVTSAEIGSLDLSVPLTDANGQYLVSINGQDFTFTKGESISSVMNKINSNSKAGVIMSYSSISDKFTLTAKDTGIGENIVINEHGGTNLMTALGITASSGSVTYGKNAILSVNGQAISRTANDVLIDGVSVKLEKTSADAITVKMEEDGSSLMEPIKKFIEDYNSMLDLVTGLVNEKINKDYQPLTDQQKADMTEKQIEQWEAKAKSGVLRGDSMLNAITTKVRTSMYQSVNGFSLYDLGIQSGGYKENGKLVIDNEDKLKAALKSKGSQIRDLFASENGLAHKLNGIIDEAAKTTGPKGSRGSLIEAAGFDKTTSDGENNITANIDRTNKYITTLKMRLKQQESRLWSQFTAMETALNGFNSQSAIIGQFGSQGQ